MLTLTLLAEAFIIMFHFRGHEHSIDMILTYIINNNIIIVKYTHVQYLSWSSPHEWELTNSPLFIICYFSLFIYLKVRLIVSVSIKTMMNDRIKIITLKRKRWLHRAKQGQDWDSIWNDTDRKMRMKELQRPNQHTTIVALYNISIIETQVETTKKHPILLPTQIFSFYFCFYFNWKKSTKCNVHRLLYK